MKPQASFPPYYIVAVCVAGLLGLLLSRAQGFLVSMVYMQTYKLSTWPGKGAG